VPLLRLPLTLLTPPFASFLPINIIPTFDESNESQATLPS
jgi:hypothetical protein